MISLKQLKYALAVETHLHFRKAAEACSVSQSALSTALSEMERQLGFEVFERDNKKVLVTPIGKQLLDKARQIHLQLDDLMKLAEAQKSVLSYPMSVGIIPTICPFILPIVLPKMREVYPDFQVNVVEEQSHQLVDKVRSGEIDTAILALPYSTDGLLTFEFWHEDFFWVTHKDDAIAGMTEVESKDIDQSNLMLLKDGHCLKDHALSACNVDGNVTHSLGATSLSTLIQLVIGKAGTTLIPKMALNQLVQTNAPLNVMRLTEVGPHRRLAFVVRPNYAGLKNIEALMSLFKEELTQQDVAIS